MKVIAFAGSSSRKSINKALVTYAASLVVDAEVEILDLNDFEMPLFSVDKESELGAPPAEVLTFIEKIKGADALLISFAEHNGGYSAAYKNLFDWVSRTARPVYQNKPTVLFAASPGKGGAKNVLAAAVNSAPHFGMELKAHASIAKFNEVFDIATGKPKDSETDDTIRAAVAKLNATV